MNRGEQALVIAVGDIAPDRENPSECFDLARDTLRTADVVFGQLETNLTTRGVRLPQARHAVRGAPAIAEALKSAGFTTISGAGNHCLDWSNEGLFDTIENIRNAGLGLVGVGANIAEARQPAMVDTPGGRIAFLAYSSILPMNYWATEARPGCAPMRALTAHEAIEHDQPGTPVRLHTFAHREDLRLLCADIAAAKAQADVVLVSLHWGIHFVPAVLADYQQDVAHAAIDAGADAILGHHAHILKGFEFYREKPIFYSLCNFATDLRMDKAHAESKSFKEIQALSPDWIPDFDSLYNFPPDSRLSAAVKLIVSNGAVRRVSLAPIFIERTAQPRFPTPDDPRFDEVERYLNKVCEAAGLNARCRREGSELALMKALAPASGGGYG